MKTRRSVLSTMILASLTCISGCMSDNSNADSSRTDSSPAGVWYVQTTMSDSINDSGSDIRTQMSGRQLVVLEETGHGEFRLHDCTANFTPITLNQQASQLRGAYSLTDKTATSPYSESGSLSITLDEGMMHGQYKHFDRNFDGSWDSEQTAYFEGHKVTAAETLEALSQAEIDGILGGVANRSAATVPLGATCTGIASMTTNGTIRARPTSQAVADLLRPERQPDLFVASEGGR